MKFEGNKIKILFNGRYIDIRKSAKALNLYNGFNIEIEEED